MLAAVVDEAQQRGVTVNRVSQGSGAMLLSRQAELREMARIGADAGLEVSLFVGPREEWGTFAMSRAARTAARWPAASAACASSPTPSRMCCAPSSAASAGSWSPTWACWRLLTDAQERGRDSRRTSCGRSR